MCGHRKRRTASLTVIHVRCDYLYFSNLCAQDPLYTLSADERGFLWQHRMELVRRPQLRALPKFLLSVPWGELAAVLEAYRLLYMFESPGPLEALQLLDARFPDPKVRAFAVQCLDALGDAELSLHVQASSSQKNRPAIFLLRLSAIADT